MECEKNDKAIYIDITLLCDKVDLSTTIYNNYGEHNGANTKYQPSKSEPNSILMPSKEIDKLRAAFFDYLNY